MTPGILSTCSSVCVVASATCKLRFALAVALSRTPSSPWVWGAVPASWVWFGASWLARPVARLAAAGAAPVSCAVACSDVSLQPALSRAARAHVTKRDHVERYIQPPCCGREFLPLRVPLHPQYFPEPRDSYDRQTVFRGSHYFCR